MSWFGQDSVTREGNVITISSLQNYDSVDAFIKHVHHAYKKAGYEEIQIKFDKTIQSIYPNAAVPIAGLIDFFRREKHISIEGKSYEQVLQAILTPYELPTHEYALSKAMGKIWKFETTNDICQIQQAIVNELRRLDTFAEGILEGIEWSINEIMDNVLNHSEAPCGFIMGQLHKNTKNVVFTIYDTGIGIYNSLKNSIHAPRTNADALTMCIQAGVTRDKKIGQGNGMNGLLSLVKEGKGRLVITSGRDSYTCIDGKDNVYKDKHLCPSNQKHATTIDFQLDYSTNISIEKVLTFQGHTFEFVDLYAEGLENEYGDLVYKISEMAEGTGTRESANRLKNEMINLMRGNAKKIVLDFEGINVVTSSFIDELMAKLIIELGIFQFNQRIGLRNMSSILQQTLQKSVIQRIIEEYQ